MIYHLSTTGGLRGAHRISHVCLRLIQKKMSIFKSLWTSNPRYRKLIFRGHLSCFGRRPVPAYTSGCMSFTVVPGPAGHRGLPGPASAYAPNDPARSRIVIIALPMICNLAKSPDMTWQPSVASSNPTAYKAATQSRGLGRRSLSSSCLNQAGVNTPLYDMIS